MMEWQDKTRFLNSALLNILFPDREATTNEEMKVVEIVRSEIVDEE